MLTGSPLVAARENRLWVQGEQGRGTVLVEEGWWGSQRECYYVLC